ncbi:hypothetical protein EVAR_69856_1 [Eumeta japonica]|uniref:Uncharacterized protein n=1 Tax=Eumeta variegata TaxID=151549 RepID=A0A4C2A135_EUMVA|nr:hypothetical protein EVAR_69856_1 [Eumeta japonica]
MSQKESCNRLRSVCNDEAPSFVTVYNLFNAFKCGRTNLREGRPSTAPTEDNINALLFVIETDKSCLPVDSDMLRHRYKLQEIIITIRKKREVTQSKILLYERRKRMIIQLMSMGMYGFDVCQDIIHGENVSQGRTLTNAKIENVRDLLARQFGEEWVSMLELEYYNKVSNFNEAAALETKRDSKNSDVDEDGMCGCLELNIETERV